MINSLENYGINFKYIPIICGATASGKSSLALGLCDKINGELVSADSMQIYKYFDIGTAKATKEEQNKIPHHMIDIIEPDVNYSVSDYVNDCYKVIDDILSKGKLPVICGGTGQYVKTLVEGIKYNNVPSDDEVIESLYNKFNNEGIEDIYNELVNVDPDAATKIHPNNTRRVIRALSVYKATGKTFTYWNSISKSEGPKFPFKVFMIDMDRAILYDRINKRVDIMLEQGLLEEVQNILKMDFDRTVTAMQAIGYKEFIEYFDGKITLEEAVYQVKLRSRHYAKRQLTWYRYMENINLIDYKLSEKDKLNYIIGEIVGEVAVFEMK